MQPLLAPGTPCRLLPAHRLLPEASPPTAPHPALPKPPRSPWAAAPLLLYFIKRLETNETSQL